MNTVFSGPRAGGLSIRSETKTRESAFEGDDREGVGDDAFVEGATHSTCIEQYGFDVFILVGRRRPGAFDATSEEDVATIALHRRVGVNCAERDDLARGVSRFFTQFTTCSELRRFAFVDESPSRFERHIADAMAILSYEDKLVVRGHRGDRYPIEHREGDVDAWPFCAFDFVTNDVEDAVSTNDGRGEPLDRGKRHENAIACTPAGGHSGLPVRRLGGLVRQVRRGRADAE